MDETTIALLAVGGLALLSALSPIRIPLAVLLAMLVIRDELSLDAAAICAAAGGAIGRILLALEARRERSRVGTRARTGDLSGMRDKLKRGSGYPTLTFIAGLTPVIPERFLFGVLGALRLPMRYAVIGAFVGQYLLMLLGGWLFISLTRAFTEGDRDAVLVLGLTAILFIIMRTTRRFDSAAWRGERKLRMRPEGWEKQFVDMLNGKGPAAGAGPGGGAFPFFGMGGPTANPLGGDVIEGDIVDENTGDEDDDTIDAEAVEDDSP